MTTQPMKGVRVLEVAQFTFTPSAGAVLADWGADVIKVEHAVTGDAQRGLKLGTGGAAAGSFQPLMEHPNRGKRSIGLALEVPEAHEILLELAKECDVFLTNFLPAARRRLKLEVEDLRAANPNIIYVRGERARTKRARRVSGAATTGASSWGRGSATPSSSAWSRAAALRLAHEHAGQPAHRRLQDQGRPLDHAHDAPARPLLGGHLPSSRTRPPHRGSRFDSAEKLMANADEAGAYLTDVFRTKTLADWREQLATLEGQWAVKPDRPGAGPRPAGRRQRLRPAGRRPRRATSASSRRALSSSTSSRCRCGGRRSSRSTPTRS